MVSRRRRTVLTGAVAGVAAAAEGSRDLGTLHGGARHVLAATQRVPLDGEGFQRVHRIAVRRRHAGRTGASELIADALGALLDVDRGIAGLGFREGVGVLLLEHRARIAGTFAVASDGDGDALLTATRVVGRSVLAAHGEVLRVTVADPGRAPLATGTGPGSATRSGSGSRPVVDPPEPPGKETVLRRMQRRFRRGSRKRCR